MSGPTDHRRRTERVVTREQERRLFARVLIVMCLAVVVLVVSVWLTSYQDRQDLVRSQRGGCERGKLDREANAQGWRIAQAARQADGDIEVANKYATLAVGLENRAQVVCAEAYPDPPVIKLFG